MSLAFCQHGIGFLVFCHLADEAERWPAKRQQPAGYLPSELQEVACVLPARCPTDASLPSGRCHWMLVGGRVVVCWYAAVPSATVAQFTHKLVGQTRLQPAAE